MGLLGGDVEVDADDDATLRTPGGLVIDFLRVPETKAVKNRVHLDLRSTDLSAAVRQAVELGATRADDVYKGEGFYQGVGWCVLRDPEGNEFCILGPTRS